MNSCNLKERTVGGLHEYLINKVLELQNLKSNTPVLDVGCGTGAWLNRLYEKGFNNLYGIDKDTSQFAFAKAKVSEINCDMLNDWNLKNSKFGLITAIEVIEHLENPGIFFNNISNILDDDGYLLITTPNIHSIISRFKFLLTGNLRHFDAKGDLTHIYPVHIHSLKRILKYHKLKIVDKFHYPEDGGSLTSRSTLKIFSKILGFFLPEPDAGDILCILVKKRQFETIVQQ